VSILIGAIRRDGAALLGVTLALIVVGATLTGVFVTLLNASNEQRATDGASILAQEALHRFAADIQPDQLASIQQGRDTIMTRLWVTAGDSVTGGYTVHVARLDDTVFAVKSTGSLIANGTPVLCSVNVVWRTDDWDGRARLVDGRKPTCNGLPHKSNMIIRTSPVTS
jgi:hypothetical protein